MKRTKFQRITALVLILAFLLGGTISVAAAEVGSVTDKTTSDIKELLNAISYNQYSEDNKDVPRAESEIVIDATESFKFVGKDGKTYDQTSAVYKADDMNSVGVSEFAGKKGLYLPGAGTVTWTTDKITQAAKYTIVIEYYPVENKTAPIERIFMINGEVPFGEARYLSISKIWRNAYPDGEFLVPEKESATLASVESLLTSSRTQSGKRFESETHVLYTEREHLVLRPKHDGAGQTDDIASSGNDIMVVRAAGTYNFNGRRFRVEVLDRTPEMSLKQPAGTLLFDADILRFPFVCRRWRQGDWLIPFGMRGKKKVSDIFADLKFSAADKYSAVILVDTLTPDLAEQQHIAALLGHRIDDRYKVTSTTRTILRITVL